MIKNFTNLIFTLIAILLLCQVALTSWRSTDGDELMSLESAVEKLEQENSQIKSQIYALTSIDNIQKFAADSLMVPSRVTTLNPVKVATRFE